MAAGRPGARSHRGPGRCADSRTASLVGDTIIARYRGDFQMVPVDQVQYIDVAPGQMVGVSAGLIPFLEHDDANRALMGSNMQRQAVPLLDHRAAARGHGHGAATSALNSSMLVRAQQQGRRSPTSTPSTSRSAPTSTSSASSSASTSGPARTRSRSSSVGEKVEKGQVIADGAATYQGELALGRNVLVAFMAWDGFNFEDAIIISEELVKNDTYTSIHIEEFDIEIRETKLGREEFTRDIPNVSEKALRNLDENGIVRVGTYVRPGDILVGKVSPKSKTELTPEEKLLHAIFGRAGEDVKNDSLEVPSGVEGIVIDTQKFSRRMSLSEDERKAFEAALKEAEAEGQRADRRGLRRAGQGDRRGAQEEAHRRGQQPAGARTRSTATWPSRPSSFNIEKLDIRSPQRKADVEKLYKNLLAGGRSGHRRHGAHAELDEARRRAPQRRAADGQGLRGRQAGDLGGRQDGRPARQQGRDRQDPAPGRHALPGRRHAGPNPAQPAGRSQPYERGPDSRDAPGLGRRQAGLPGHHARLRRGHRSRTSTRRSKKPACPNTARPSSTTAAPASRSSSNPRWATSTC